MMLRCGLIWTMLLAMFAPRATAQDTGATVYKKVVKSTVWVHSERGRSALATGTGTLINVEKRWILTNYHVVEETVPARVFFPVEESGEIRAEKKYYTDRLARLAYRGKVIAKDRATDLAIIQLEKLPDGAVAVPLATESPEKGSSVHSVGNAGKSGGLWGYVAGKVRNVYRHKWSADLDGRVVRFEAKVVETDSSTNPGDSGGPLVNDRGEMVGVTEGKVKAADQLSTFIDVSEVKKLILTIDTPSAPSTPTPPAAPKREKATVIKDEAKLFTAETVGTVQKQVDELFTKHKFDVLIETAAAVPAADKEKVRSMSRDDRRTYMRDWARRRIKEENIVGFVIIICDDPKAMYVDLSQEGAKSFPKEKVGAVIAAVQDGLKSKTKDDVLTNALKTINEHRGMK
ncbi:MAG: S1 family peptidase [Gemmataceae bacterium]